MGGHFFLQTWICMAMIFEPYLGCYGSILSPDLVCCSWDYGLSIKWSSILNRMSGTCSNFQFILLKHITLICQHDKLPLVHIQVTLHFFTYNLISFLPLFSELHDPRPTFLCHSILILYVFFSPFFSIYLLITRFKCSADPRNQPIWRQSGSSGREPLGDDLFRRYVGHECRRCSVSPVGLRTCDSCTYSGLLRFKHSPVVSFECGL